MSFSSKLKPFEENKLRKALSTYGSVYTFYRENVDAFGEPDGTNSVAATLVGIYHDAFGGYVSETVGETSRTLKKYQPMILSLLEDSSGLDNFCFLTLSGRRYFVKFVKDINDMGYAGDITLEVELSG